MIRTKIANTLIGWGRKIGYSKGSSELAVKVSDHSIDIGMVDIDERELAWDHDMFHRGNLFYRGYANPLKIDVDPHDSLLKEGDADADLEGDSTEATATLMSSSRYEKLMFDNTIADMINPSEQWKKILYILVGIGILQFLSIIVTLWGTGNF